ncbi:MULTISPECIES: chitobiase/beta-hexosaminidase C-terminal domain-containing protein [unclassified Streptomyces]|uniref:chitobiase/beta-hexosaminidase C-terminal domain-containing protein n=1 Tax=unclassified Streptomyces TaxID=2593676 RepID=UPI000966DABC|nr:chitobiase/beta-hexosaminidase C-terminal domain-containing protein [Streptomyces sp. TSRI0281]OKI34787.1 phosphoesterase [Streptomyces sp. TSRI0281]
MRFAPLVIAATSVALVSPLAAQAQDRPQAQSPAQSHPHKPGHGTPAAPGVSVPGGRYEHPVSVKFKAERGVTVRYTLDGTTPTRDSRAFHSSRPLRIAKDTNVTAVAFRGNKAGVPVSYGYLIKTREKPLAKIVVMSDVHIGSHATADKKYESFFDTIGSIFPKPDAILSNGDMINDNGDGKGPDHKIVSEVFQANLARKGMTGTQLLISNGNHDASLDAIRAGYPKAWFPDSGGGYYESKVKGLPVLTVNTETYNSSTAQRTWLKERLTAITANPANAGKPVLVQGHRPTTGTTMDGQQAANPLLAEDLSAFPQAVLFSGHSHLNINDDRSIHQRDFTSVNDGSMSYIEVDHGYQMVTDEGLANRFESPTAQALFVEVYKNRTEIARVNMAADKHDIYTGGQWSANWQPPYASAGTLSGDTWTVRLKGSTSQEIKRNFRYTAAERNTVAPKFTTRKPLKEVRDAKGGTALRIAQAKDDQMVHHYNVDITDASTGASVVSSKVLSDFYFTPRPNTLDIPVPGAVKGNRYVARVVAVDAYGNASPAASLTFRK